MNARAVPPLAAVQPAANVRPGLHNYMKALEGGQCRPVQWPHRSAARFQLKVPWFAKLHASEKLVPVAVNIFPARPRGMISGLTACIVTRPHLCESLRQSINTGLQQTKPFLQVPGHPLLLLLAGGWRCWARSST